MSPRIIFHLITVTFVGKLQTDTDVSKNGYFGQTKQLSFHEATAAKTPIKISNIRKVRSPEDSSNGNVLVNAKSQLNVVRILTFQYHAMLATKILQIYCTFQIKQKTTEGTCVLLITVMHKF